MDVSFLCLEESLTFNTVNVSRGQNVCVHRSMAAFYNMINVLQVNGGTASLLKV